MRRAAKIDANQPEIVAALRACGVSVVSLASIGRGCPDLLAARGEQAWLIEVKMPDGKLTPDQEKFIGEWRGVVHIIRSSDEALKLVGVL